MPLLALFTAAIFWGGNYVVGKVLSQSVDALEITILRWLGATILIFCLYHSSIFKEWQHFKQQLPFNIIYSLLGQIAFPLSLYLALQYTTALNAAIYMSATPSIVLAINYFAFKEPIYKTEIMGVAISTLGVIYLSFMNSKGAAIKMNIGDLLALLSAVSWAIYCSLLRFKQKTVSNTVFVGFTSAIGVMILLPFFILYQYFNSVNSSFSLSFYDSSQLLGIAYLVIFPSWLAYVFWSFGVSKVGAKKSDIFTHLIPISGGLFGILFLAEALRGYHLISIALIASGIVLCNRNNAPNRH